MIRLIIICVMLSSCAGTVITRDNALKKCWSFGIKARTLVPESEPFKVVYVGKDIDDYCRGYPSCIYYEQRTIYMMRKDWWLLADERCHEYTHRHHSKIKKKMVGLSEMAKDK